jgi:catechol 2,3-dioxygenase-like lactoylglutathione lyase family enzyme
MLGSFLEVSMSVSSLAEELRFYRRLGFEELPVADFITKPYVAVWDGAIVIGLHMDAFDGLTLSFVRPNLKNYLPALKRRNVQLADTELGEHQFNRVRFQDPDGQAVAVLEARTYSTAEWDSSNVAACGEFSELLLPAKSIAKSADFWTGLGLDAADSGETPHPWTTLRGGGIVLGFHQTHLAAGISYRAETFDARSAFLRARGLSLTEAEQFGGRPLRAATIYSPSGFAVYMLEATPG